MNWKIFLLLGFVWFGNVLVNCCGNDPVYRFETQLTGLEQVSLNYSSLDTLNVKDKVDIQFYFLDTTINSIRISQSNPFSSEVYACSPRENESKLLEGLKGLKVYTIYDMNKEVLAGQDISGRASLRDYEMGSSRYNLRRDFEVYQPIWTQRLYYYKVSLDLWIDNLYFVKNDSMQLRYEVDFHNGKKEVLLSNKYYLIK